MAALTQLPSCLLNHHSTKLNTSCTSRQLHACPCSNEWAADAMARWETPPPPAWQRAAPPAQGLICGCCIVLTITVTVQVFSRALSPARARSAATRASEQQELCSPSRLPRSGPLCVAWPSGACGAAPPRWGASVQAWAAAGACPSACPSARRTSLRPERQCAVPAAAAVWVVAAAGAGPPPTPLPTTGVRDFVGAASRRAGAAPGRPLAPPSPHTAHQRSLAAGELPKQQPAGAGLGRRRSTRNRREVPDQTVPAPAHAAGG